MSSVISISLVLMLAGSALMILANAGAVADYFKENVKLTAELSLSADETSALILSKDVQAIPGVRSVDYISKEQGIREMEAQLGSGFLDVFEVPPIPVSLEVSMEADYVRQDSLEHIKSALMSLEGVESVYYHESVLQSMNANIEKIGGVFILFIALLMFISFVLISNTVRLNLYSKRFTIYTMQLVGATKAFIRSPFVLQAFFQGMISGLLATAVLVGLLFYIRKGFVQIFNIVSLEVIAAVLIFVVLLGIFICVASTVFVVNKLVNYSKDDLYL